MTEHYTDVDPLRGCGCMILMASAVFSILVIAGIVWLAFHHG